MRALDGQLKPLTEQPVADQDGLPKVEAGTVGKTVAGWWWIDMPGLRGGSRLELELALPDKDAVELVVDAPPAVPVEWWHHPAGWAIKVASAELLTVSASYLERPGPLPSNPGYLLDRKGQGYSLNMIVEVVDTRLTVRIAGSPPVVVDEPLALGGSEHRGIALRWFSPLTRLKHLRIERLAKAELVSALVGPDALLRHGQRDQALAEYRLLATDHQGTALGAKALLRAYAVSALKGPDGKLQEGIYREICGHEQGDVIDQADRIRAKALWSCGEGVRALGVARDLVARRPDLNPILSLLADRTWSIDRPCGPEVLGLLAAAPSIGSLALPGLGITDLTPIAGRRAWSVAIAGNQISDLSPLAGSGCINLVASANRIADLAPLAGLGDLATLHLGDNRISDLRPLAGLSQLSVLTLATNSVASLAGLPAGIQELQLGMPVEASDTLRALNPLEPRAGGNPLADLAGLPVAQLRNLGLAGTRVADLAPLAQAAQLVRLDLSDTPVRDLAPLRGLPLTELYLSRCADLDPGTLELPKLQRLTARGLPTLDGALLARLLPGLTNLNAEQCRLESWPAVAAPALTEVNLSGTPLRDHANLRLAPALKQLHLRGCGLRRIDPALAGLPLQFLDLRDNALSDVAPLLQRPPAVLQLSGNPLDDAACEALIAAGRRLSRPDLAWQGASILAHRRGDLEPLRRVALPLSGRRCALYVSPEPIAAAEAQRLAAASGGRLAVCADEQANRRLAEVMPQGAFWLGVSLQAAAVVDDTGQEAPFVARMPPLRYRGYSALPRDGGRLALAQDGNWALCLDGRASGMVVEWDEVW
jgi:Leucine-rich repeat (LRR) protein